MCLYRGLIVKERKVVRTHRMAPRVVHLQPVCAYPGFLYLDPVTQLSSNTTSTNPVDQDSTNQAPSKPIPSRPTAANMCGSNAVRERQLAIAKSLKMADAQAHEMKPYNQEPNTMYWFREKNGEYVQHPYRTIDGGDLGRIRWYRHKDLFYATAV
ncbi:hypothetical protein OnM2_052008 [Erysiphe neolycopersici]|uniref:Uncharacterized protein n=1 Tax=Erysiphe neolycopersici TaxID=212602 RepID=A0A420HS96_9PEZI|nr:hypothetical protein OnM2_052008 [Erysiphe neolycopersici]